MKLTSEAKLLAGLAAIVLAGGGFLMLSSRTTDGSPRPDPTPAPSLTAADVDKMFGAARHTKGKPDAALTIVEFADFECPSCRRAYNDKVKDIEKKLPARLAFLHLPLPMHERAVPTALATEAAAKQGKFWPIYDALFEGETASLDDDALLAAAKKVGLNVEQFNKDRAAPEAQKHVDADTATAGSYRIDTTPTFVIRDKAGTVKTVSGAGAFAELYPDLEDGVLGNTAGAAPAGPAAAPGGPAGPPPGPPPAGPAAAAHGPNDGHGH